MHQQCIFSCFPKNCKLISNTCLSPFQFYRFDKIIAKQIPANIVYEDDKVFIFFKIGFNNVISCLPLFQGTCFQGYKSSGTSAYCSDSKSSWWVDKAIKGVERRSTLVVILFFPHLHLFPHSIRLKKGTRTFLVISWSQPVELQGRRVCYQMDFD